MNRANVKKRMSTVLAMILIFAMMIPQLSFAITDAEQAEIDRINSQMQDLENEIAASQSKIDEIERRKADKKSTVNDYLNQVNELDAQISNFNKKIALLSQSIAALQAQIKTTQENMKVQEQEISKTKELLSERMRAMYMAGETSSVEILMSADSFETFLTRMELVQSIARHDSKLIDELQKKIDELKAMENSLVEQQTKVQADKDAQAAAKAQLMPKKKALNSTITLMNREISNLNKQSTEKQKIQQRLEAQKEAFENELDRILSGETSSGSGSVGAMIWPLPYRGTYITSPYGYRTMNGVTKFHYGIDISMADKYNKNLVASADGTVIYASNDGSWNGGYGNYLRIDHGNGVVTVYGHCQSLKVVKGQKVTQGQPVAIMGTSGNSTGVHVHFEVRINNVKKNPLNYVNMPPDAYIKK